MNPVFEPGFARSLRHRDDTAQRAAHAAMHATAAVFGQPHLHSGRGIRRISRNLYECRASLELRLVFYREASRLVFTFVGTHSEVRAYLKNRR